MLSIFILSVFTAGYLAIIFEHKIGVNKTASALLLAVACWVVNFIWVFPNESMAMAHMNEHLGHIGQVVFYLLGAMTIVGIIETYQGFVPLLDQIRTRNKQLLLIAITFITFFLSAALDNMTTVIVMAVLIRPLIADRKERMFFAAMIVIAANAGGAWSPIGDVTTTMLWIDHRVSSGHLIVNLLMPSLISVVVPLIFFLFIIRGKLEHLPPRMKPEKLKGARRILILGISSLIFVPVLHSVTGIPPYMGIMLGLGLMWVATDLINQKRHFLRVPHVLSKVDVSSVLFFLGILLGVAALETSGVFQILSGSLEHYLHSTELIISFLGVLSAVLDNVPMTAAIMNMYGVAQYPADHFLWHLTAYCVGTGGSLLIIGSAAGVVMMGVERISFGWYLRWVTLPALAGYIAGLVFLLFK